MEDLGGGSVGGLPVRIRTDDQDIDANSDPNGVIVVQLKRSGRIRLAILAADWHLIQDEVATSARPVTVQLYRDLEVVGRIRVMDGDPPDLSSVTVGYSVGLAQSAKPADVSMLQMLARHGLPTGGSLARPNQDGVFQGVIPRLPGFVVHASLPGWHAEGVPLIPDSDGMRASVLLELRRGTPLRGQLLDDRGNPVPAGTLVQVYVTVRGSLAELTPEEAYRLRGSSGCGMTCRLNEQRDEAIASFRYVTRTDETGGYSLVVEQRGELNVRAHVVGHLPAAANRGWLAAQENQVDLIAKRDPVLSNTQIRLNGVPPADTRIELLELVSRGPQMAIVVRSDANGRIPTSWLVQGQEYMLYVGEPPAHAANRVFIRWDGRDVVNVIPFGEKGFKGLPMGYW